MHNAIVQFPSKKFYAGNLLTDEKVKKRRRAIWHEKHEFPLFPPYLVNVKGRCYRNSCGGNSNDVEATFITSLVCTFSSQFRGVKGISIGIITFYNDQVALLRKKIFGKVGKWINSNEVNIQISTVDSFQGSEKDIIILSCVRSNEPKNRLSNGKWKNNIGFLQDFRRVNVALTRARESLWIVCNCNFLETNSLWKDLIMDASRRNLIAQQRNYQSLGGRCI